MKPLPIRLRLTLWYFAMFASAALLLTFTSWWMLRRTLDATIHQDLQERVDDVRAQLQQFGLQLSPEEAQARFDSVYRHRDDGKWLQIMDENGRWIYRSPRMAALNPTIQPPHALVAAGVTTDLLQGGRPIRIFSRPVFSDGHAWSVQTGISMSKPGVLLHSFGLGLLLLTPAVLFAAAIGGHVMSRKALAPVAVIAHEVRRITDRNLDRRLPVSQTSDELSHLSITLNHMLQRIDVAFRSVREFTANASHELRTPLARLRAEAEITLLGPREGDEYRKALERVHQDAVSMTGLIDSLLTLARAEARSEVLRMAAVDLRNLMERAAREWQPLSERLSMTLRVSADPAPILVAGDRPSLERLLHIWLDNAFKFTPPGGTIAIVAIPHEDFVSLAVEDTGAGIAPEHHARIYERFYRVNGATAQRQQGAGLGLSLAAWIAEQHKTRIDLRSAPGEGSRFEIRLRRITKEESAPGPNMETSHRGENRSDLFTANR
jgi:heavy metal sensor kinase